MPKDIEDKNDINSYNFPQRVQNGINLMNEDHMKAYDYFNELLNDFLKFDIEEIKDNGLSSELIDSLNAKGSLLNAMDLIDEAEESFDMILENLDQKDYTALMNKALILRKRGKLDDAINAYDKVRQYYPMRNEYIIAIESEIYDEMMLRLEDADLDDYSKKAVELIEEGLSKHNQKLLFEALGCYDKALKIDSSCQNLILSLASDVKREFIRLFIFEDIDINEDGLSKKKGSVLHYLFIQNNLYYAYVLNQEILDENENDLFALNAFGMIFFYLDEYELSIDYFDRAIDLNENYLYPYFNKALSLKRIGKIQEAKDSYKHIKALAEIENPSDEELDIFKRAFYANSIYSLGL